MISSSGEVFTIFVIHDLVSDLDLYYCENLFPIFNGNQKISFKKRVMITLLLIWKNLDSQNQIGGIYEEGK
jgi:hypothetical protein